jgi:EAL and modified HD-GYP domain-containing signal transduction protein
MMPIASLLPVVNSQQKLVALLPDFPECHDESRFQLTSLLAQLDSFERLSSLQLMLPLHSPLSLPPDFENRDYCKNLVLCFTESECESKEAQQKLKHLSQSGLRIMMDEFSSKSSLVWPDTKGVSVNCKAGIPAHIQPWIFSLQQSQHLAKNVDTVFCLSKAQELGFSLFSGDFAFSAENNSRSADPTARSRLLKLLGLVSKDADAKELESLFKQDPALSFMLFKLVSSAAFAQTVKVTSFVQAINLLGRRQLQRWLQLLLYARQNGQGTSLNPLMLRAAFRASLMEALCRQSGGDRDQQDCAFMVGMFSLLGLLFASPLWEILKPLSLPDEVRAALLDGEGQLGQFLNLTERADRTNTQDLAQAANLLGLSEETYYESLIQAYSWVNQVCQEL